MQEAGPRRRHVQGVCVRLGQAVMIPEPRAPHTGRDSGSTAHHRMGNAGSEGAQRTQAGGPRSILGEETFILGL